MFCDVLPFPYTCGYHARNLERDFLDNPYPDGSVDARRYVDGYVQSEIDWRTKETMFDFLRWYGPLPSREHKQVYASNSELRRWFERGSVEVNGEKAKATDRWPISGDLVVIHPKGKNKTTLA